MENSLFKNLTDCKLMSFMFEVNGYIQKNAD